MSATVQHEARAGAFAAGTAFVEGAYVPVGEARLPVLDWGFLRSDATYDVVHVWHGRFFRLEDHLDRFERSCARLHLTPPCGRNERRDILMRCVRLSGLRDAYVEMICTRGMPPPGSRDPRSCRNTFMAFAVPFVWIIPPEQQRRGAHLIISAIARIPPASVDPTVKNYHWADLTRGLFEAYDRGADTVVLVDADGNVSEGPGFNLFCVTEGRVATPRDTVLEGITRRTVMELCAELDIPCTVGPLSVRAVRAADEVFLSSTAGGIMPVTRVDGRDLGDGAPGPLTERLRALYWARHEDPAFTTPVDY
jgi:branched-chain amino acid aminotransferase